MNDDEISKWAVTQIEEADRLSNHLTGQARIRWLRELTYGKVLRFQAVPCVKIFGDALLKALESR